MIEGHVQIFKSRDQRAQEYLTPDVEEQTLLRLAGKCPHNKGWINEGTGHSTYDQVYRCRLCNYLDYY